MDRPGASDHAGIGAGGIGMEDIGAEEVSSGADVPASDRPDGRHRLHHLVGMAADFAFETDARRTGALRGVIVMSFCNLRSNNARARPDLGAAGAGGAGITGAGAFRGRVNVGLMGLAASSRPHEMILG